MNRDIAIGLLSFVLMVVICGTAYAEKAEPRIIDYGVIPWGLSPTTVWSAKDVTVPEGKVWYVLVQLIDGAVAEQVGWHDKPWQLMWYHRVFGSFESPEHHIVDQPLESGEYSNLYLKIYHEIAIETWDGSTLIRKSQTPSVFWQVIEIDAEE